MFLSLKKYSCTFHFYNTGPHYDLIRSNLSTAQCTALLTNLRKNVFTVVFKNICDDIGSLQRRPLSISYYHLLSIDNYYRSSSKITQAIRSEDVRRCCWALEVCVPMVWAPTVQSSNAKSYKMQVPGYSGQTSALIVYFLGIAQLPNQICHKGLSQAIIR